ncbi:MULTISPECIES: MotA/TolQ/ExbB proton channel family protein [unclassified Alcanivorax]|jgi:biopolymer transport protein ExbB/TolQ|uniref:MotA/TolQ/ExbB proton channel family protein n=1 Tax=unclassified Alcanivorax TaxID=2638842 RepID=UPI000789EC19|nr:MULTISPECIES: MotA/TolQ/ExbB proton channel family protein [unclassified Alcanivorax]KZX78630.1 flagellar motor protein MotA [Alcanivorax sp. HI0011]KZX82506.1 flagellar motor protein MotA [Alcanivorax sp. HI0013]KZY17798.1 flagellar motor protein MotA [Alcanivorax sp. HI0035]MBB09705.1 MotA/TolQ/ExbB proton channel family protein [Alcanivorax sp.]MEE2603033.1 MotA/TolQ/ExbB proton channel family protein [Pseudomonadota bacterium]
MPTTATAQNTGVVETAITFIQDGGFFMYPILVVLALGLALSLERIIYLQATKAKNQKTWKDVYPLIAKGQFRQALDVVSNSNTGMAKVIGYGLERAKTAKRHDDIELAMEEGLMEIIPRLEARTPYIGTFANIATLLGLLGTILGLISAFTAVASADPAQKADLLSASISVAMNTTAFGLIAAIPMLLAFAFINAMAGKLVDSMEMASVKFVNVFRQVSAQQERKNDGQ